MILPHVLPVVVELQGLGLADLVHIRSVSVIPEVGGSFVVAFISLEFVVRQFQLANMVAPLFAVRQQAPEFLIVGPDGEDRPGEHLGDPVEQGIIAHSKGSVRHGDKVRQRSGCDGVFAGGLVDNTLQQLGSIIETMGGTSQGVRHVSFLLIFCRAD